MFQLGLSANAVNKLKYKFLNHIAHLYNCSHLWSTYGKSIYSKIRVAYYNVFRKLLKLPLRVSCLLLTMFSILKHCWIFNL